LHFNIAPAYETKQFANAQMRS